MQNSVKIHNTVETILTTQKAYAPIAQWIPARRSQGSR